MTKNVHVVLKHFQLSTQENKFIQVMLYVCSVFVVSGQKNCCPHVSPFIHCRQNQNLMKSNPLDATSNVASMNDANPLYHSYFVNACWEKPRSLCGPKSFTQAAKNIRKISFSSFPPYFNFATIMLSCS